MSGYRSSDISRRPQSSKRLSQVRKRPLQPLVKQNGHYFGQDRQKTLGSIQMKFPIGKQTMIIQIVDVVQADVPFLFCHDIGYNGKL